MRGLAPLLLLAAVTLSAQDADSDFHIAGTVVDSKMGQPLRQALVTLTVLGDGRRGLTPNAQAVLTDATGRFYFGGLSARSYAYHAQKNGFEPGTSGFVGPVQLGPSQDAATISLVPLGKIAGKVTDTDGEPAPGVNVRALLSELRDGRRSYREVRSVGTDDRGQYRLWNLKSGDYYLVAAGKSGGTVTYVGPVTASGSAHEGFPPVYYPAAKDRASATPIHLAAGEEFQADLKTQIQPAYRVRGVLRSVTPYQSLKVELLRGADEVSANRVLVNAASGRFEAADVIPGAYLLRATQGSGDKEIRGERTVNVAAADVDGLTIDLLPGVTVTGIVRGTLSKMRVTGRGMMRSSVTLVGGKPDSDPGYVQVAEDGKFAVPNLFPGQYRLQVSSPGYVASAVSGSDDLLHGDLVVGAGAPPPPIEVVIANDAASISVTVPAPDPANRVDLLLVPLSGGEPIRMPAFISPTPLGNLAPGDYRLYLVKDIDKLEFRNPEVVRSWKGVNVHLSAGATENVTITEVVQ